jgi:hypothetical protein
MNICMSEEELVRLAKAIVDEQERRGLALSTKPTRDSRLLSRQDLAAELHVSVATVARWLTEGVPHVLVGSTPRYRLADVEAWLASRSKPAPAPATEGVVELRSRSRKARG